jgi:PilZ domain
MLMDKSPSLLRSTLWWKFAGELSIRIAVLKSAGNFADKIRETWRIGEVVMERRFVRNYVQFPVDLRWTGKAGSFNAHAGVVDISKGGVRIGTGAPLIPGRLVHIFLEGKENPFAFCRVVWAQTHGGALPSEAGLEVLEQLSDMPFTGHSETSGVIEGAESF